MKLLSWEFLLSWPLQWTPKCKILQLYIFRFFTVKRRRNFAKHFMIHTKAKSCLLKIGDWSSSLPGVSGWHLKWNFRKLCQHLFNLSSCETSSISHNPLSSYYCCWISSSVVCKMKLKLHFWCQASSKADVVKLTIFYKEAFYSIQIPFVNFIALHVRGQFYLYWSDDVQ